MSLFVSDPAQLASVIPYKVNQEQVAWSKNEAVPNVTNRSSSHFQSDMFFSLVLEGCDRQAHRSPSVVFQSLSSSQSDPHACSEIKILLTS